MPITRRALFFLSVTLCLASLTGCGDGATPNAVFNQAGTVRFQNLSGGFWGIVGDNGQNYEPTNLAQEFRQEGTRVRFSGVTLDGATTTQWGRPVNLTTISRL